MFAGWFGFLCGCIGGAVPGLFFHKGDWLGGYGSWPRRMIRLAHIAFFGIGLINICAALTARCCDVVDGLSAASLLLIIGAVSMPAVCYLSAWRKGFRNLFFVPALSVTIGIGILLWRLGIS